MNVFMMNLPMVQPLPVGSDEGCMRGVINELLGIEGPCC